MKGQIIPQEIRGYLGLAFDQLSGKIVEYKPDVACLTLRAGKYVWDGIEHLIRRKYRITIPSVDAAHIKPPLLGDPNPNSAYSMNRLELVGGKEKIDGKKIALVDDLECRGTTLNHVRKLLFGTGAFRVRSFCLYNNTSLKDKIDVEKFHKDWHVVVKSIGDLVPWKQEYRIEDRIAREVSLIRAAEALEKLDWNNWAIVAQMYHNYYGEVLTKGVLRKAMERRRVFKSELSGIIDRHLRSRS